MMKRCHAGQLSSCGVKDYDVLGAAKVALETVARGIATDMDSNGVQTGAATRVGTASIGRTRFQ
jgi:enoyl-[acyl-carrier-protein] reductase (NADH)